MHPLRPKEGRVLVCEGRDDVLFLTGILDSFATSTPMTVYEAGGSAKVSTLSAILAPAVYVLDRDFKRSSAGAIATLSDQKARTYWSRIDLEAYLLHTDWLWAVVELVVDPTKPMQLRNAPTKQETIERQIHEIAKTLVYDHAGRRTIEITHRLIPSQHELELQVQTRRVDGGAKASDHAAWADLLKDEATRIHAALRESSEHNMVDDVLNTFEEQITFYQDNLTTLDHIRQEFSGKRILQALTERWHLTGGKSKAKPWQKLQRLLIEEAVEYAKMIEGNLSDDSRLGDVGKLGSKVLGQKV